MTITRLALAASALLSVAAAALAAQPIPQSPSRPVVVVETREAGTSTMSCLAVPARDIPSPTIVGIRLRGGATPVRSSCLAAPEAQTASPFARGNVFAARALDA